MKTFGSVFLILFILSSRPALAQKIHELDIKEVVNSLRTIRDSLPVEKVYVQTDKSYYFSGDTIWFKAYVFDAAYLFPSKKSGVLYLELANDSNKVVKRLMAPVAFGLSRSYIAPDAKEVPQGSYVVRAYTNWMRNFGESYVFHKQLYISDSKPQDWLVKMNAEQLKEKARMQLRFTSMDNSPVGLREMQLRVLDGKRTLVKNPVETTVDGALDVSFTIPEKANTRDITLQFEDLRNGQGSRKLVVPVILNRAENIDLQFMPESGSLVGGTETRVGFKAIGEDGKGTYVSGELYNSKGQEVTSFSSSHKGMGSFMFLPKTGESYTARINLADGKSKSYAFPAVKVSGTVLRLNDNPQSDSLELIISASPDVQQARGSYYLIGQSRGVVCYAAALGINKNNIRTLIDKSKFATGIARFTLLNSQRQPLNERLVFINHQDELKIAITTNKTFYTKRDSVSLDMQVTDALGKPVQGSFSIAVTDDSQVKTDSLAGSITSNLLLTSDLIGTVEDPGYYFHKGKTAEEMSQKVRDLNNLLLTQGWVGYSWNEVFSPKPPLYKPEKEALISGRVTNITGKPVAKAPMTLLSSKPVFIKDTVTNREGRFTFRKPISADTNVYVIQAKNRRGVSNNVGIQMDDFKAPLFTTASANRSIPWYVNTDTIRLSFSKSIITKKKEQGQIDVNGILLEGVIITGKRTVKGSKNLNGPGEADLVLDEPFMEKANKKTLREVLKDRVPEFRLGFKSPNEGNFSPSPPPIRMYLLNANRAHIIVDGMNLDSFIPNPLGDITEYYDTFLDNLSAEDIKGIEIIRTPRYQGNYTNQYVRPFHPPRYPPNPYNHTFIEVTTRSGTPFSKARPGVYVYKPMPFSLPAQFYSPKYRGNGTKLSPDFRSSIYWKADIITDLKGQAKVSFYSADKAGNYSLVIEGADMEGSIGRKYQYIVIKE
jgi:hypothetical protein